MKRLAVAPGPGCGTAAIIRPGRLIGFEGLDGAGKTTTAALLAQALTARGEPAVFIEKKCTAVPDPQLADRMVRLKALIWDYGDAPILDLGDEHSLYIMASWFAAFDRSLIRSALAAGTTVVVDNWHHKFLARFRLKRSVDFDLVRQVFGGLSTVDHVIYLDIPSGRAAKRKTTFTQAETGNLDGLRGLTRENFVSYQENVRAVLHDFAAQNGWLTVAVGDNTPAEITATILAMLPGRDGEFRRPAAKRRGLLPRTGEDARRRRAGRGGARKIARSRSQDRKFMRPAPDQRTAHE